MATQEKSEIAVGMDPIRVDTLQAFCSVDFNLNTKSLTCNRYQIRSTNCSFEPYVHFICTTQLTKIFIKSLKR